MAIHSSRIPIEWRNENSSLSVASCCIELELLNSFSLDISQGFSELLRIRVEKAFLLFTKYDN